MRKKIPEITCLDAEEKPRRRLREFGATRADLDITAKKEESKKNVTFRFPEQRSEPSIRQCMPKPAQPELVL